MFAGPPWTIQCTKCKLNRRIYLIHKTVFTLSDHRLCLKCMNKVKTLELLWFSAQATPALNVEGRGKKEEGYSLRWNVGSEMRNNSLYHNKRIFFPSFSSTFAIHSSLLSTSPLMYPSQHVLENSFTFSPLTSISTFSGRGTVFLHRFQSVLLILWNEITRYKEGTCCRLTGKSSIDTSSLQPLLFHTFHTYRNTFHPPEDCLLSIHVTRRKKSNASVTHS